MNDINLQGIVDQKITRKGFDEKTGKMTGLPPGYSNSVNRLGVDESKWGEKQNDVKSDVKNDMNDVLVNATQKAGNLISDNADKIGGVADKMAGSLIDKIKDQDVKGSIMDIKDKLVGIGKNGIKNLGQQLTGYKGIQQSSDTAPVQTKKPFWSRIGDGLKKFGMGTWEFIKKLGKGALKLIPMLL